MRRHIAAVLACSIAAGCTSYARSPASYIGATEQPYFLAPALSATNLAFRDGQPGHQAWDTMTPAQVNLALSTIYDEVTVEQIGVDGKASFMPATATFNRGSYRVTYHYYRTRPSPCPNAAAGHVHSGVGIRMVAHITTTRRGVNVTNLMGLSGSASQDTARGQLSIRTYGLSSETSSISPYMSSSSSLTPEGLRNAVESFAVIKAVIETPLVRLTPYDLYIEGPKPQACAASSPIQSALSAPQGG